MKNLKWSTICLLIYLTIFFNIERLDFGRVNIINISSFVYAFGIISVIIIILLPRTWRFSVTGTSIICIGIYLVCKAFLFDTRPFIGGIYTYISITEITLLTILVWLSYRFSNAVREFEEAVENILLSGIRSRAKPMPDAEKEIQTEMIRSRRTGRPLSVIIIKPEPISIRLVLTRIVKEVQQAIIIHYVFARLGHLISDIVRRTDIVIEQREKGQFVLVCPETSSLRFKNLADRIQASATEHLNVSISSGTASFPDESLTFEELVQKAEAHIGSTNESIEESDQKNAIQQ